MSSFGDGIWQAEVDFAPGAYRAPGLPLPEARRMLMQAGYRTVAKNTDTTFGIC